MYTNPSNILKSVKALIEKYNESIEKEIKVFVPRKLTIFEGMRKTIPASAFPCLEIEPISAENVWATTRGQRPKYNFQMTLSILCDNENVAVEYISTLTSCLVGILSNPMNLQLIIQGETKWDINGGVMQTMAMDSFPESTTYSYAKDGSIRRSQWEWWAEIHETYPDSYYWIGKQDMPDIIFPTPVVVP